MNEHMYELPNFVHTLLDTLCPQSPEHYGGAAEQVLRRLEKGTL